jgi:hypothetical protein
MVTVPNKAVAADAPIVPLLGSISRWRRTADQRRSAAEGTDG